MLEVNVKIDNLNEILVVMTDRRIPNTYTIYQRKVCLLTLPLVTIRVSSAHICKRENGFVKYVKR